MHASTPASQQQLTICDCCAPILSPSSVAQPDAFLQLCASQLEVLLEPVFHSGKAAAVLPLASILGKLHERCSAAPQEGSTPPNPAREAADVSCSTTSPEALSIYLLAADWLAAYEQHCCLSGRSNFRTPGQILTARDAGPQTHSKSSHKLLDARRLSTCRHALGTLLSAGSQSASIGPCRRPLSGVSLPGSCV